MNCEAAKKLIPAFLDGELVAERSKALRGHLADCQACRQESADIERTMRVMAESARIEPAITLADIRRRAGQRRSSRLPWLPPLPRFASAAMVLAAMAVGGISGAYHGSHSRTPVQAPAVSSHAASDSLSLDAFDDGLAGAIYVADAGTAPMTEVTR